MLAFYPCQRHVVHYIKKKKQIKTKQNQNTAIGFDSNRDIMLLSAALCWPQWGYLGLV